MSMLFVEQQAVTLTSQLELGQEIVAAHDSSRKIRPHSLSLSDVLQARAQCCVFTDLAILW